MTNEEEFLRQDVKELREALNKRDAEIKELTSKNSAKAAIIVFLCFACFFMLYTLLLFQGKVKDLNKDVAYYQEKYEELQSAE